MSRSKTTPFRDINHPKVIFDALWQELWRWVPSYLQFSAVAFDYRFLGNMKFQLRISGVLQKLANFGLHNNFFRLGVPGKCRHLFLLFNKHIVMQCNTMLRNGNCKIFLFADDVKIFGPVKLVLHLSIYWPIFRS